MSRKLQVIVACSALVLFPTAAAHAKEGRIQQRVAGASVNADPFHSEITADHKGAPGTASSRSILQFGDFGPPSEQCEGYEFETPVLGGLSVVTFADLSQLSVVFESGFVCGNVADGARDTVVEGNIVGGSGRFEGATGTVSVLTDGVALSPSSPNMNSFTGSVSGTFSVDD